jgi:hypothetical protein
MRSILAINRGDHAAASQLALLAPSEHRATFFPFFRGPFFSANAMFTAGTSFIFPFGRSYGWRPWGSRRPDPSWLLLLFFERLLMTTEMGGEGLTALLARAKKIGGKPQIGLLSW